MFSGARQPQHARTAVRLLPREEEFFDLFVEVATRSTLAAQHLRELFDAPPDRRIAQMLRDRKSTRLNSSHDQISYAVFCLKKKKKQYDNPFLRSQDCTPSLHQQRDLADPLQLRSQKRRCHRTHLPPWANG